MTDRDRMQEFRAAVRERLADIRDAGSTIAVGSPLGMAQDFDPDFGDISLATRRDVCQGEISAAGLDDLFQGL